MKRCLYPLASFAIVLATACTPDIQDKLIDALTDKDKTENTESIDPSESEDPSPESSDPSNEPRALIATGEATKVSYFWAVLTGYANPESDDAVFGFIYSTDSDPSYANGKEILAKTLDGNKMFKVSLLNLDFSKTYYYRAFIEIGDETTLGEVKSFTTLSASDFVSTGDPVLQEHFGATISESYNNMGLGDPRFFVSSQASDLESLTASENEYRAKQNNDGSYTLQLKDLIPNTTYHYVFGFPEVKFYYFDIDETAARGKNEYLILNDGGSWQINKSAEPNIRFGKDKDFMFILSRNSVEKFDYSSKFDLPEHEGTYRVYVLDKSGFDNLYLYVYGDENDLGGSWPGITPDHTGLIIPECYGEVKSFTSNDFYGHGTLDDPYTTADVQNIGRRRGSSTQSYIKGTVTKGGYSASSGLGEFWITDYTGVSIQAYKLRYFDNDYWIEGEYELAEGDEVLLYSEIHQYQGEAEAQNGYLYSITDVDGNVFTERFVKAVPEQATGIGSSSAVLHGRVTVNEHSNYSIGGVCHYLKGYFRLKQDVEGRDWSEFDVSIGSDGTFSKSLTKLKPNTKYLFMVGLESTESRNNYFTWFEEKIKSFTTPEESE